MRRRRRSKLPVEVELNLAAMLDMAFQLLAFFILTFRPAQVEGQVMLHLPPPRPVTMLPDAQEVGSDKNNPNPAQGLNTITITVLASPNGKIAGLSVGDVAVPDVGTLSGRLKGMLSVPGSLFDQVLIQVASGLEYQSLMDVIDVCTRQELPSGERLSKLGFAEIPGT